MLAHVYWMFYNLRLEQTMAVSSQEPVGFKMPVWFFLLLPLTISANHPQNHGHQDHLAPKVLILMKKWRVYKIMCLVFRRFDDLCTSDRWRGWDGWQIGWEGFLLYQKKNYYPQCIKCCCFFYIQSYFFSSFDPSRSLPRLRICWTQLKTTETWFTWWCLLPLSPPWVIGDKPDKKVPLGSCSSQDVLKNWDTSACLCRAPTLMCQVGDRVYCPGEVLGNTFLAQIKLCFDVFSMFTSPGAL